MNGPAGARIRILHLRASAGSGGGPEKTIFNTASRIDAGRFDYQVVYLCKHGQDLSGIAALARDHGARYQALPGRAGVDPVQLFRLARLVRRQGIHILHGHEPKSDLYIRLLGLAFPAVRRVTTLHGFVVRPDSRKSALLIGLDKRLLSGFHAVVAVSEPLAALARDRGARDVRLLRNAIDTDAWRREQADPAAWPDCGGPDRFTVGYVGRLSPEKAPLDFLRVAGRIAAAAPEARFVLAGQGPERDAARDLAATLGLADRVRFLGQLAPAAARDLYPRLACLLSPSLTEGLPNHLLEALAMATPVVATDVGGVGELITDGVTGLLRPARDLDGLARAVLRLRDDQGLAVRLAAQGRDRVVARFSFAERTRRLMALYDDLMAGRPGGAA